MRQATLFAALLLAAVARAEDWVELPTATSWYRFAYDRDSITRRGQLVHFWDRTVFLRTVERDPATGRPVGEKRVRRVVHCTDRVSGVVDGRVFDPDGRLLESVSYHEWKVDLVAVERGTQADRLITVVCSEAQ